MAGGLKSGIDRIGGYLVGFSFEVQQLLKAEMAAQPAVVGFFGWLWGVRRR